MALIVILITLDNAGNTFLSLHCDCCAPQQTGDRLL